MADEMTSHDQELLEYIAGVRERWADGSEFKWGAAMSVRIEFLHGCGYVRVIGKQHQITEKGKKYLETLGWSF